MKGALLVGGTGFVGSHLRKLLEPEYMVTAVGREFDIRDKARIETLVQETSPNIVVNLAFITTVRETFANPERTYQTGFYGMLNLLSALKRNAFQGRMLNISSSEVYGFPEKGGLPIKERNPLKPMSPYSVAKLAAEALCHQWSKTEGLEIITARPFTHIGPGQSDRFALSSFSKQLAEMLLGRRDPVMRVGNLECTRDITDVRDVVRAYKLLLESGINGEIYNVCSASEIKISALLEGLIDASKLHVRVETDERLVRATEQQRILGDYTKLNNITGWRPEIPLSRTLPDMIEWWKQKLA